MLDEQQIINDYLDDSSLIFKYINMGYYEIINKLIDENKVDANLEDNLGNDVVTRLLKAKQYDLVIKLMKKKNWDVNHKNIDGDTFGHVLASDNSPSAVKVIECLNKKKNYSPNIKNNKGETIFDRAVKSNYLLTALKVLEDKRFDAIRLDSFKRLFNIIFKNREYGKYTRINTLEIIVGKLEKRDLDPTIGNIVESIIDNMEKIKNDILNNDSRLLYSLFNSN